MLDGMSGISVLIGVALLAPPAWGPATGPQWTSCGLDARQECASVSVPVDYADPGGPRIDLAVSRIRTAQPGLRRGVLLLIPGGPGNPGLNLPSAEAAKLPKEVLDRYDLVGFDPRGVGASSPVSCGMAPDDVLPSHSIPWPGPGGDIAANVARARRMAEDCDRNGGPLLAHLSTRDEARDLDLVRRALGEPKISYWGTSYGTYVGAVYATLYPRRTDRVVLDSNDDPDPQRVALGWAANYAVGVVDRFPDFAAWAANHAAEYDLGGSPAQVRDTFQRLATRLDADPLPALDGNALRQAMLGALYSDADFPALASLMHAAITGGPLPLPPTPPQAVLQNVAAVVVGTICNDVGWPRDVSGYARAVAANRLAYPLTNGMPVNIFACAFRPGPAEPAVRVTARQTDGVLMVQNLRDPATPYSGALKMREALGDRARMVTVNSGGHGSYLDNGNACGDAAVTAYLAYGTRPARDVYCG
jgi:pimeloyl-ACP methyl ester carboxylesterase